MVTTHASAASVDLSDPKAVAAAWMARWCPFRWTEPVTARRDRVRSLTTPAAWRQLDADPVWWRSQVVATRTVATCSGVSVSVPDQRLGGDREMVGLFATRRETSGVRAGVGTERVVDERVLERQPDGHWLVGARVEGG